MASSSQDPAAIANILGKRKWEDDLETKPILRKSREKPEDKTLYVANLSIRQTKMSDIVDFFSDVGEVVRVRLIVTRKGKRVGYGFVQFASANQAKRALEYKNGEYLHDREIILDVPYKGAEGGPNTPPKYCIEHTVWYEDELPIKEVAAVEDDETPDFVEAVEDDETPDFVEAVLFVANLSPYTTRISHIIDFFSDVGEVIRVRLIVNHEGKHVGYGFLEFASAYQAKKALEKKNGKYLHDHKILLMKGQDQTPDSVEEHFVRKKTLFIDNLSDKTKISDIMNFFEDVGEVVHVRLAVDDMVKHVGYGFVELASRNQAKKALPKKGGGEYLHGCEIKLDFIQIVPYPPRPLYCIDHKVWYEDYLHDETPDFVEEAAVRKKTVFVANQALKKDALCDISNVIKMFKKVGEVVGVRLIVDHRGEHVGCGFVEFASADEAKKAVQEMDGYSIFLKMAEIAPYPFRPKDELAEKFRYEDNLRRVSLDLETRPTLKKKKKEVFDRKKYTFDDDGVATLV